MTLLATWLENQMGERDLSLRTVARSTGVSICTLSDIVRKGHVPKSSTLLRLADYFGAPREQLLALSAGLPYRQSAAADLPPDAEDDFLIRQVITEFRRIPDEWKADALAQLQLLADLARRPRMRIIGAEEETREE